MAKQEEIRVPDIGDFNDVEVIEVLVAVGDTVTEEQSLITLESDKASLEVPAPRAGRVIELKLAIGDRVSEGAPLLVLEVDEAPAESSAPEPAVAPVAESVASAPASSSVATEIHVPDIGVPDIGDFDDVEVIEVLVAVGDTVVEEQSLITLESDKASLEVPAPRAGRVIELKLAIGDRVSEGALILLLEPAAGAVAAPAAPPTEAATAAVTPAPAEPARAMPRDAPLPAVEKQGFRRAHASPGVRRFARELGADLGRIDGSGPKGRVLKEDVKSWVKKTLSAGAPAVGPASGAGIPPIPEVDFSQFGDIERVDLPRIKRLTGPHLRAASAPCLAQSTDGDSSRRGRHHRDGSLPQVAQGRG